MAPHRDDSAPSTVSVLLSILSAGILLYSILVTQQFLLGVYVVVFLFGMYLFWRIVIAIERIAAALETDSK